MAKPQGNHVKLLIGTRKGAFTLTSDPVRHEWKLEGPLFLGHIIYHYMCDPRDANSQIMAMKAGHLGPTVFFSKDGGKTWKESSKPPQFPKVSENGAHNPDPEKNLDEMNEIAAGDDEPSSGEKSKANAVDLVFWLSPGHEKESGVWYAGTSPPGMFVTTDGGDTWAAVDGFNSYCAKTEGLNGETATPGGQLTHSILIDPRDSKHMYVSISVGGTFESLDAGKTWTPINKGVQADFLPAEAEYGHDPHFVVMHPKNPDRLYQQNHCGIYRIDRPARDWVRIGDNMPKEVGDIGFPIVVHPHNEDRAWVFPMDGTEVWPRTSPGGRPAVYETADGGSSWHRHDLGLPTEHGYFTVKRQAMCSDAMLPLGLYFGTTCGEIWGSLDEGASYNCLVRHLPEIFSVIATLE